MTACQQSWKVMFSIVSVCFSVCPWAVGSYWNAFLYMSISDSIHSAIVFNLLILYLMLLVTTAFFEKEIKNNNFTYATVTISPNPRAAPLNCAIKITIITSYRQVPSMLTVAPMGHMKRISLLFFPTLFSKQSMVKGKVMLLKKYRGLWSFV